MRAPGWPCSRSTSATARPRRMSPARPTPTLPPPASSSSSFCEGWDEQRGRFAGARRRGALRGVAARGAHAARRRCEAGRDRVRRRVARRSAAAGVGPGRRGRHHLVVAAPRRLRAARPVRQLGAHAAAVRRERRRHPAARRRALHRAHDPRGAERTVRLRAARGRAARGAGRWRRARAPGAGGLRRSAGRAVRKPASGAGARRGRALQLPRGENSVIMTPRNPQLNRHGELIHLLSIEGLPREIVTHILDTAAQFVSVGDREVKKVPLLRGKSVFNLFFENSTRTRTTFEIAATRLSADVINLDIGRSSTAKGESLLDTIANLSAMAADLFVVRHGESGAPYLIAQHVAPHVHVVNAGDGRHAHPTQALLDMYTIRHYKRDFSRLTVAIVGDVLHSRVARSDIHALTTLGCPEVRVVGPKTLVPPDLAAMGVRVCHRPAQVRALDDAGDRDLAVTPELRDRDLLRRRLVAPRPPEE